MVAVFWKLLETVFCTRIHLADSIITVCCSLGEAEPSVMHELARQNGGLMSIRKWKLEYELD